MRFSLIFFSLLLGCNTNYMVGPQTINIGSEGVTYDRNAVKNCLRAISVMPCQNSKTETAIGDNEFVATLIFTRYHSCNFRPIEFWEINEPIKGRL